MKPYLLEIFGFRIPSYGIMIASAYIFGYLYILRKSKKFNLDRNIISDLIFYSVVCGFIGAKIFYIITFWGYFGNNFYERLVNIFSINNLRSGFIYFGGLIGGLISFIFYIRKNNLDFYSLADIFSPALALAHAIGRVGCFLAGCCHGKPTSFFGGVVFNSPYCDVSPELIGVRIHPSQLYESVGNILIFIFLNSKVSKVPKGYVFFSYIFLYSIMRFILEFSRGDERGNFIIGLSQAQLISIVAIFLILIWKIKK
ncbi:MAG: prolipoprotein diacylglyceryl transferase [Elusimicrobiales bacterium]|nr:prolipoprotein diacylglyceryl transferase [Elusimicrobiales bacterium]